MGPARDEQVAEHGGGGGHDGKRLLELGRHCYIRGGRLRAAAAGRRGGGLRGEGCPRGRRGVLRC